MKTIKEAKPHCDSPINNEEISIATLYHLLDVYQHSHNIAHQVCPEEKIGDTFLNHHGELVPIFEIED
jgi:hypothetical protein